MEFRGFECSKCEKRVESKDGDLSKFTSIVSTHAIGTRPEIVRPYPIGWTFAFVLSAATGETKALDFCVDCAARIPWLRTNYPSASELVNPWAYKEKGERKEGGGGETADAIGPCCDKCGIPMKWAGASDAPSICVTCVPTASTPLPSEDEGEGSGGGGGGDVDSNEEDAAVWRKARDAAYQVHALAEVTPDAGEAADLREMANRITRRFQRGTY